MLFVFLKPAAEKRHFKPGRQVLGGSARAEHGCRLSANQVAGPVQAGAFLGHRGVTWLLPSARHVWRLFKLLLT